MSKDNMFKGPYADSLKQKAYTFEENIQMQIARADLEAGDKIEFSLYEQIERAQWELDRARLHYKQLLLRRDSGVTTGDSTPGRDLDDYSDKHGK